MMPLVSFGWDVVVFVLCLAGFFFLVFANEREGRRLLYRPDSQRERRICAEAGGVLLCLALWVCVQEWRGNFGSVLWFGWLTVAAGGRIDDFQIASTQGVEMSTRNVEMSTRVRRPLKQAAALPPVISLIPDP
jgi:hypothetical protein